MRKAVERIVAERELIFFPAQSPNDRTGLRIDLDDLITVAKRDEQVAVTIDVDRVAVPGIDLRGAHINIGRALRHFEIIESIPQQRGVAAVILHHEAAHGGLCLSVHRSQIHRAKLDAEQAIAVVEHAQFVRPSGEAGAGGELAQDIAAVIKFKKARGRSVKRGVCGIMAVRLLLKIDDRLRKFAIPNDAALVGDHLRIRLCR